MMKAPILLTIIASTLLISCDPWWVFDPPYTNTFYVENNTDKDVTIYQEWDYDGVWRKDTHSPIIEKGKTVMIYTWESGPDESKCRPSIMLCVSDSFREERYLFVVDDVVVRVWNRADIGKEIPHHFYDDDSWSLNKYQKEDDANVKYKVTYYDWTYTITDEDLTIEQSPTIE